jgi:hypothetical protein
LRHPATRFVLNQITPLLHPPQQLDGKEWVTPGLPEKRLTEVGIEPVRFGIKQGFDERLAFRLAQIEQNIAKLALKFVDNLLQGMAFRLA